MAAEKVILDCDPGVDDFLAALLLLSVPDKFQVEALTLVSGNHNDHDILAQNACFILDLARQSHRCKVVKGSPNPLLTDYHGHKGIEIHGKMGLGDDPLPFTPSQAPLAHDYSSAAACLVDMVLHDPGNITVVAIGPLTNVAAACLLNPKFASSVKRLVIMGGATTGKGNAAPIQEANIYNDPDAAKIVFQQFSEIAMADLNLTRQLHMDSKFREEFLTIGPVGEMMYKVTAHYTKVLESWGSPVIALHDPAAVMFLLHPEIYEWTKVYVDVETQGSITRGATVVDWRNHWGKTPQTLLLTKVDEAQFKALYMDHVGKAYANVSLTRDPLPKEILALD